MIQVRNGPECGGANTLNNNNMNEIYWITRLDAIQALAIIASIYLRDINLPYAFPYSLWKMTLKTILSLRTWLSNAPLHINPYFC